MSANSSIALFFFSERFYWIVDFFVPSVKRSANSSIRKLDTQTKDPPKPKKKYKIYTSYVNLDMISENNVAFTDSCLRAQ